MNAMLIMHSFSHTLGTKGVCTQYALHSFSKNSVGLSCTSAILDILVGFLALAFASNLDFSCILCHEDFICSLTKGMGLPCSRHCTTVL